MEIDTGNTKIVAEMKAKLQNIRGKVAEAELELNAPNVNLMKMNEFLATAVGEILGVYLGIGSLGGESRVLTALSAQAAAAAPANGN